MGLYSSIQSALDAKLATVPGLPKLIRENDANYVPVLGTPYCLSTLMPAEPSEVQSELGEIGGTYFHGLFQVLLVYPRQGGASAANAMADVLLTNFKRGMTFSANSINITVRATWRNPAIAETAWWSVPVMIRWYSLTRI